MITEQVSMTGPQKLPPFLGPLKKAGLASKRPPLLKPLKKAGLRVWTPEPRQPAVDVDWTGFPRGMFELPVWPPDSRDKVSRQNIILVKTARFNFWKKVRIFSVSEEQFESESLKKYLSI
jgi:hypothetical protein